MVGKQKSPASRDSRDEAVREGGHRCPRCGDGLLVFRNRSAVIAPTNELKRQATDPRDPKDRLRYEPAWVCLNPACGYQERIANE